MEALDTRRHRSVLPTAHDSRRGRSMLTFPHSISSIVNRETIDRFSISPTYTSAPTMAAAALVSPASIYSAGSPPPFYAPGWPAPSASVVSGLISPPDSRRTSDNKPEPMSVAHGAPQQQQRQSLPSLQEALSSGGKPHSYTSASPIALHPSQHYSQSQAQAIPRTYPPEQTPYQSQPAQPQPRRSSPPHPVHPQPTAFGRPDPIPASFAETPRHNSITSLQTAPPNQYAPRFEPLRHEPDLRAPAGGYTHQPSPPPPSYPFNAAHQAPPRHPQAYDEQSYASHEGREQAERWKGAKEDGAPAFRVGLKRHLDVWDFENNLAQASVPGYTFEYLLTGVLDQPFQ